MFAKKMKYETEQISTEEMVWRFSSPVTTRSQTQHSQSAADLYLEVLLVAGRSYSDNVVLVTEARTGRMKQQ
ncbi:unnamed protein product [Peronospora belbahrii]|uniref:Uncharacterized protein n=1 Tax=Peronospora belbahrii TaxID=622444 RepID=A0AAU9KSR4_9STRA|nr:unnamed protein product [Peronospora belbahrii]